MLTGVQLPVPTPGPLTLAEDFDVYCNPNSIQHCPNALHLTSSISHLPVQRLGHVPIIAEDLGVITSDVNELRQAIGAPGMVVLQFAWGSGAQNTHIPHNHYENSVCYPGKM